MDNRYFVGLGEILWDCFEAERRLGGAPANCAYHAAQFGHQGIVVSAIGQDADGDAIVEELNKKKLPHLMERVEYPTGTVDVDLTDANDPKYTIHTEVAWSHIPFTAELKAIAAETKAVCFGTLAQWYAESRGTIQSFLDATPADCLKVFDVNLRQTYYHRGLRAISWIRNSSPTLSAVTNSTNQTTTPANRRSAGVCSHFGRNMGTETLYQDFLYPIPYSVV